MSTAFNHYITLRYPLQKHRIQTAFSYRTISKVKLVRQCSRIARGPGFESNPSEKCAWDIFFTGLGESTEYTVVIRICVWVKNVKTKIIILDWQVCRWQDANEQTTKYNKIRLFLKCAWVNSQMSQHWLHWTSYLLIKNSSGLEILRYWTSPVSDNFNIQQILIDWSGKHVIIGEM